MNPSSSVSDSLPVYGKPQVRLSTRPVLREPEAAAGQPEGLSRDRVQITSCAGSSREALAIEKTLETPGKFESTPPSRPAHAPKMGLPHNGVANGTGSNPTSIAILDETPCAEMDDAVLSSQVREEFKDFPHLEMVLEKYIADVAHPMNIVSYLKRTDSNLFVIQELKEIAGKQPPSQEEFKEIIDKTTGGSSPLFRSNDAEFSTKGGRKKSDVLKEELLKRDPILYSTGDNPTSEQMAALQPYAANLRGQVVKKLARKLKETVAGMPREGGFPAVNARAKTAEGIIDKIHRMRIGNDRKDPRPDYCLADMPDAIGGRITVKNTQELEQVLQRLEEKFGKENIFEKDNFYSNPKKKHKPYRVITYTVMVDDVPCEVQVTTLKSSLVADLHHNTKYKKLHQDIPQETLDYIGDLQRLVTAEEHRAIASTP